MVPSSSAKAAPVRSRASRNSAGPLALCRQALKKLDAGRYPPELSARLAEVIDLLEAEGRR